MVNTIIRQPTHIRFKELWIVSKDTFPDLKCNHYLAIRGLNGKTYRSAGFNNIDNLDKVLLKIGREQRAKASAFKESDKYGVDLLED